MQYYMIVLQIVSIQLYFASKLFVIIYYLSIIYWHQIILLWLFFYHPGSVNVRVF